MGSEGFKFIRGCNERKPGDTGHVCRNGAIPPVRSVEARSDGSSPLSQFINFLKGPFHPLNAHADLMNVT